MNNDYFKNCMGIIHYVKRGDTLYSISRMHGVTIDELIDANPMINVYNMQEGDEVCVPVMQLYEPMEQPIPQTMTENLVKMEDEIGKEDFYELVKRFDK